MKIDLHIHTKTGSDGNLPIDEVFREAKRRNINFMSVTDHDNIDCQNEAFKIASDLGICYISGVELNVTFTYKNKPYSLDFLGYDYDPDNAALKEKLQSLREHREKRAQQILQKLNEAFDAEGIDRFTEDDIANISDSVNGSFGRPHIANYLVKKGVVRDKQQAFDKYLVRLDVPKYPLSLEEASHLIRDAGGVLVHAHPADDKGTSLWEITTNLNAQTNIISQYMLEYIDGVECWYPRSNKTIAAHYTGFARRNGLIMTGGSDCHQKPIILGTVNVPGWVADQFKLN
ncbi:MAG: PHP domain-containing protein [Dehalococcoidia bacterium]